MLDDDGDGVAIGDISGGQSSGMGGMLGKLLGGG
jgi:hypothetical protein